MHSYRSAGVKSRSRLFIRPFDENDAGQVAGMSAEYFTEKRQADLRQVRKRLLDSLGQPNRSLVCSSSDGSIHGYLSVKLLKFTLSGSTVTGAVFSDFMADEKARSALMPMRMLQVALKGSQNFSFTDDAARASRLLWCRLGGQIAYAYSNYYTIPLKPLSFFIQLTFRNSASLFKRLAESMAGNADSLISRVRNPGVSVQDGEKLVQRELTGGELYKGLDSLRSRYVLFPSLDIPGLETFIKSLKMETEFGIPVCVALMDSGKRPAAWYICYMQPRNRRCNMIHADCLPGKEESLYASISSNARSHGCISVSGRLTPDHIGTSFSEQTLSRPGGKWSLVHSKNPEILHAIQSGGAFLTRCW